ncbi:hypothetical protein STN0717ENT53_P21020 (plasmid) [Enterobacter kobei]|nr:hypothetical protein STN0717ENT53_P21020 [Enterobacter kobei]
MNDAFPISAIYTHFPRYLRINPLLATNRNEMTPVH